MHLEQVLFQLLFVHVADDLSLLHHRNDARFLGHRDDERVGFLAETHGRAMTRPERLGKLGTLRQRKKAAHGRDAIQLDNDPAVVKRRVGHEDGYEKLGREHPVESDARLYVRFERHFPFDGDEGADAVFRQRRHRAHDLVGRPLILQKKLKQRTLPNTRETSPQFGLEDDEKSDDGYLEKVGKDPANAFQLKDLRHHEKQHEDEYSLHRLDHAAVLDVHEKQVKHEPENTDLEHRP